MGRSSSPLTNSSSPVLKLSKFVAIAHILQPGVPQVNRPLHKVLWFAATESTTHRKLICGNIYT